MTTGKSGNYHHGDLREALVTAALKLLESGGVEKLSLRALARDAGVSQTAPYGHFRDKTAVLAAVAVRGFARLRAMLDAGVASRGAVEPEVRMQALALGYVRFALANPDLFRLMFSDSLCEAFEQDPDLAQAGAASFEPIREAVGERLSRCAEPAVTPAEGAAGTWALVHGLSNLLIDGKLSPESVGAPDIDTLVERTAGMVIRGLDAGHGGIMQR
ncbi:MAG: TetR/AcrR family transcriptional regulator [Pseudomonadota bacterium]|nr:TetR/AcrR family transcriptional regulator [Pseudomonadota bacterium]